MNCFSLALECISLIFSPIVMMYLLNMFWLLIGKKDLAFSGAI